MNTGKQAPGDTRKHDRVEVSRPISVSDRQTGRVLGQLVNFSDEGIMLMGSEPIAENAVLQLSLSFDPAAGEEQPLHLGVECLWSHAGDDRSSYWSGFFIIDISEQELERLHALAT